MLYALKNLRHKHKICFDALLDCYTSPENLSFEIFRFLRKNLEIRDGKNPMSVTKSKCLVSLDTVRNAPVLITLYLT